MWDGGGPQHLLSRPRKENEWQPQTRAIKKDKSALGLHAWP